MRKLDISGFDKSLFLEEPKIIEIVIENKKLFFDYCKYCYDGFYSNNINFYLFEEGKIIDNDKNIHFISHPFSLDLNTKKNINALYKLLKKKYYYQLNDNLEMLRIKINEIVTMITLDFDVELDVADEISEDDLFKILNIQFKEEEKMSLMEKFIKYLQAINELQGIKLFIIPNLFLYFDLEQINCIKKEISYLGLSIISIENGDFSPQNQNIEKYFLDNDLCNY